MSCEAGLHALALAAVTEIVFGPDRKILYAIADDVSADAESVALFLLLVDTYAAMVRRFGPDVLQRQGLHVARLMTS